MSDKSEIHPDMRALVDGMAALPAYESFEHERREWHALCLRLAKPCPPSIRREDRLIPGDDADVPVRVYWPEGAGPDAGCVVYLHGGGFVSGTLETSDFIAWGLAEETGAVTVSVDYRLAPEQPYPAAFDDSFTVVRHLHGQPGAFGIDPARIAVTGDSAGGNLSAAVCLAARDRGGPPIAAQALVYPGLGLERRGTASTSPTLADGEIDTYRRAYLGERMDMRDPYAKPLFADDFSNLPPCFIHTAEHDVLVPDGEAYAERLRAAGTPVTYRCALGMVHSFLRVRDAGPAVAAEFAALCAFLRDHVGGHVRPGAVA